MKNYQEQAKRTCASLGSYDLDLAHMTLGLTSELNELEDAIDKKDIVNISEEIADVNWYLANFMTFTGRDFNNYRNTALSNPSTTDIQLLYSQVSLFSDIIKKNIAYNKPLNDEEIDHRLLIISGLLENICKFFNIDINRALENNIAKLKIRFPEKFTEKQALNRNLEDEYKELKK